VRRSVPLKQNPDRPLKRGRRKSRKRIPKQLRRDVLELTHGYCFLCQKRPAVHLHHFLAVQRFPEMEFEQDNLTGMCFDCHMAHENASQRIGWDELPRRTVEWCREVGDPWLAYLERTYSGFVPEEAA
jgi:5-methylcytosine-specific restriction endonuclease McrA